MITGSPHNHDFNIMILYGVFLVVAITLGYLSKDKEDKEDQ
jgi:preprotein translocase subunit SecG